MGHTDIDYADIGWNFLIGCPPSLISTGCAHCWARALHNRRYEAKLAGKKVSGSQFNQPFESLQFLPERLEEPLHCRKPRRIFVCPQSDLFHREVNDFIIGRAFGVMRQTPQHTYLIFSKRFERMAAIAKTLNPEFYRHVTWIASASTQTEVDGACFWLTQIEGERGLSLEPLLEPVKLTLESCMEDDTGYEEFGRHVDWVVVGCEKIGRKPGRPCNLEWIREIVRQCDEAKIPVYIKQIELNGKVVTDPAKFPKDLQRREL